MAINAIIFVAFVFIAIMGFRTYDQLVKIEFSGHKDKWIIDGRPRGVFWRPPGSTLFSAMFSRPVFLLWVLKTPEWTIEDSHAKALMKRYRINFFIWNVGVIVWILIASAID